MNTTKSAAICLWAALTVLTAVIFATFIMKNRVQVDMLLRQAAQPFGIVEVAPFGFQDMDGFDVFADVTVDAVQFLFQVLNPVFHNEGCENDGS